jgi:surface protein
MGNTKWTSMMQAFYYARNLISVPSTPPDLSMVSNFSHMFVDANSFNGDISNWDVSNGTIFKYMFVRATAFNGDLSRWNVSIGTNFLGMFENAITFNSDLSRWNVSNGTNFSYMFKGATAFNSDLSSWNVSNCTDFSSMFQNAAAFNSDLSNWDVSNGTLFWDMFLNATSFNSNLSNWNFSSVLSTAGISYIITNSGIDCYNLSNTIIGWANNTNTPNGKTLFDLTGLSYNAAADYTLRNVLMAPTANGGKGWTGSYGTVVADANCRSLSTPYITKWKGGNIYYQVAGADNYTLIDSSTSTIVTSGNIINGTISINSGLDPNKTYYLNIVFNNAYSVRQFYSTNSTNLTNLRAVEDWGNTKWTSMESAFYYARNLTSVPATPPNLSLVARFSYMFFGASAFNSNINNWNVSNGTQFNAMFANATSFNIDINNWKVSSGVNFQDMFAFAYSFNQNLNNWDVSNETNFGGMFAYANAFNKDISNWDVSNGTNFKYMFQGATAFNKDLSNWNFTSVGSNSDALQYIFTSSGMDCYNLSNTLIGWANNPNTPNNQNYFDLMGLSYNAAADSVINNVLVTNKNWYVVAGGVVPDAQCLPNPLPIKLLSFHAVKNANNTADIKWEIIEDEEVKLYTIEHSTPNATWATLVNLEPNTNTDYSQIYNYTHTNPTHGNNLYRLKITDVNNKISYSQIANVMFENDNNIVIYPNPTSEYVNVTSSKMGIKVISLYNTQGQKMYEVQVDNTNTYKLDLTSYIKGVYFLDIVKEDGSTSTERIIIN